MDERFIVKTIIEHGHPHYKITDVETGNVTHCDCNELRETIDELRGEHYE